ncbi:MAG: hypothetical protein AMXMBFR84_07270 [Candidatus Hydrogenedentota bacterium]
MCYDLRMRPGRAHAAGLLAQNVSKSVRAAASQHQPAGNDSVLPVAGGIIMRIRTVVGAE